jgi:hypothetical protein
MATFSSRVDCGSGSDTDNNRSGGGMIQPKRRKSWNRMRMAAALFVVAGLLVLLLRLFVVEQLARRDGSTADTIPLPPLSRPTLQRASSVSSFLTATQDEQLQLQLQQQQQQLQEEQPETMSSPSLQTPPVLPLTWEEVCTQETVQDLPFCALDCTSFNHNHQNPARHYHHHHHHHDHHHNNNNNNNNKSSTFAAQRDCWKTRVDDYVSRIPIQSMMEMMGNTAASYPPLYIPPYQWWNEGLHGAKTTCATIPSLVSVSSSLSNGTTTTTTTTTTTSLTTTTTYCPTSFPCPSGLGNAFDSTLYYQVARTIAQQARALSEFHRIVERNTTNAIRPDHNTGLTLWAPTINLQRDPRWGRNQEGTKKQSNVLFYSILLLQTFYSDSANETR